MPARKRRAVVRLLPEPADAGGAAGAVVEAGEHVALDVARHVPEEPLGHAALQVAVDEQLLGLGHAVGPESTVKLPGVPTAICVGSRRRCARSVPLLLQAVRSHWRVRFALIPTFIVFELPRCHHEAQVGAGVPAGDRGRLRRDRGGGHEQAAGPGMRRGMIASLLQSLLRSVKRPWVGRWRAL